MSKVNSQENENSEHEIQMNEVLKKYIRVSSEIGTLYEPLIFTLDLLLKSDKLMDVDEEFMRQLKTFFLERISLTFQTLLENDALRKWLEITSKLKEITQRVARNVEDYDIHTTYSILEIDLKLIQQYYLFFENVHRTVPNELTDCLTASFEECKELQQTVVNIMTNNTQLFVHSCTKKSRDVNILLSGLIAVAQFISLVDVKTTADIWKCISKVGTECSAYVKSKSIETPWLPHVIEFLCNQIIKSVSVILAHSRQGDSYPCQKIERILKVDSFYLKIVTKFLVDYGYQYFQGHESVASLCIVMNSYPESVANSKLGQGIKQYLTIGVNSLIIDIYKSPDFQKALCSYESKNDYSFRGLLFVCLQVMENAVVSRDRTVADVYFCHKKYTILDKLFEKSYIQIFQSQNLYERFISTLVAVIISVINTPKVLQYFEKKLLQGILGNNYVRGLMCCDIMNTLFRFASEDVRRHYFKFYFKIYCEVPMFSVKPNVIFIKFLLRSFYQIISDSHKDSLLEKIVNPDDIVRLAFIRNGRNLPNIIAAGGMVRFDVENILHNPRKETCYQIIKGLLLAESMQMNNTLLVKIDDMWMRVLLHGNNRCCHMFIKWAAKLTCPKKTISNFINDFLTEIDCSSMSEKNRLHLMKLLMLSVTNEDKFLKIKNENFALCVEQYDFAAISGICEALYERLEEYNFEHSCASYQEESSGNENENPPKRVRINEDFKTCPFLLDAERIATKIKNFYKYKNICGNDLERIARIISVFNAISENKK